MQSNARTISEEEEAGYNTTKLQQGSMAVLMSGAVCESLAHPLPPKQKTK
jgi:hypothetical protein